MITYKTIIKDLTTITDRHKMINSFGVGDIRQLGYFLQLNTDDDLVKGTNQYLDKSPKYPLVFAIPQPISRDRRSIQYGFNILVMDIINDDMSNEIDVHNDTLQIAEDILAQFGYSVDAIQGNMYDKYDIITPTTITPFSESFDDFVSGVNLTLNLLVDSPLDRCIAPFDDFEVTTTTTIPPTTTTTTTEAPPTTTTTTQPTEDMIFVAQRVYDGFEFTLRQTTAFLQNHPSIQVGRIYAEGDFTLNIPPTCYEVLRIHDGTDYYEELRPDTRFHVDVTDEGAQGCDDYFHFYQIRHIQTGVEYANVELVNSYGTGGPDVLDIINVTGFDQNTGNLPTGNYEIQTENEGIDPDNFNAVINAWTIVP